MEWESSDVFRFHLVPLLQRQMRVAKFKVLTTHLLMKNAVYLQNYANCPFPVDTSFIRRQMRPWSSIYLFVIIFSLLHFYDV